MKSKNILTLLLLLILIYPITYIQAEEIDISRKCNININYKYENKLIEKVDINLYKIADINQNGEYTYLNTFQEKEQTLNNKVISEQVEYAKELDEYIKKNNIESDNTATTNQEGLAAFSDLSVGLYLLTYEEIIDNNYEYKSSPILISIPTLENESLIYDIDINPKLEITTLKPSNNDNKVEDNINNNDNKKNIIEKLLNPKTGDNIMIYIILLLLSLLGISIVVLYIKRNKKKVGEVALKSRQLLHL